MALFAPITQASDMQPLGRRGGKIIEIRITRCEDWLLLASKSSRHKRLSPHFPAVQRSELCSVGQYVGRRFRNIGSAHQAA
jgi:hypothetical protein